MPEKIPLLFESALPQQYTHIITQVICQRCSCFGGYLCEEQADAHIDNKIDRNVHRIVQAGAVEVIVKEKIQGLQNEHIPHNQGKYKAKASSEKYIRFLIQ